MRGLVFLGVFPVGIVIQKFGGSSVADAEKFRRCAQRVTEAIAQGDQPVVVVSAMGDSTDDLIQLAESVAEGPDKRELDQLLATGEQVSIAMMAMTLKASGIPAVSLTGQQAAITTDDVHGRATILAIDGSRLQELINRGNVPVVAGFQGVTRTGDITTLGRGGSDTTAVALAATLGGRCEIFKDVDGVYTADPRLVPSAQRLPTVTYEEMLEAAALGSQVIHPRAVELAKKYDVKVRVLHSHLPGFGPSNEPVGTWVVSESQHMEARVVSGVVVKKDVARVSLRGVTNRTGIQSEIFSPLALAHLPVDDIIQEDDGPSTINVTFTMDKRDIRDASPIIHRVAQEINAQAVRIDTGLVTVSAVGAGMRTSSGVAARLFEAMASAGIKVENVTTSEIRISCIVTEADGQRAAAAIHSAFGLDIPMPQDRVTESKPLNSTISALQ